MTLTPSKPRLFPRLDQFRLNLLYFVALSVSLGTAVSALGRLLLCVSALVYLVSGPYKRRNVIETKHATGLTWIVLLAVGYTAVTALWSSVGLVEGISVWTRHARVLSIPLMVCMIASAHEARMVLRVFIWGQVFVVISSWLLAMGLPVPWATGAWQGSNAVFSSYLEQCITQAVLVALLWFQRDDIFGPRGRWLAVLTAFLTALLTVGLMPGRTGHLVLLGMLTLMGAHHLPKKYLWAAFAIPVLAFVLLQQTSSTFRDRMALVVKEVTASLHGNSQDESSSGMRLAYWRASTQAITEKPLLGHGAGSWNNEYKRLRGTLISGQANPVSDPHQMFLLWAVEGGLLGLALLVMVLAALWRFSDALDANERQSMRALIAALVIAGLFNSVLFGIGIGDFFCIGLGIMVSFSRPSNLGQGATNRADQAPSPASTV